LGQVTPLVEQVSIDEAFLDVTGSVRRLGPPAGIGESIRRQVSGRLGITCSVGIGRSKSVAKIASNRAKPDGLLEVPAGQTLEFLAPLPVEAIWGVGAKTAAALRRLGLATVGELAGSPDQVIARAVGQAAADHLLTVARGHDAEPVRTGHAAKSLGAEVTFEADLTRKEDLRRELMRMADSTTYKLRRRGLVAQTVAIKLRTSDFKTVTRSHTLDQPTDAADEVLKQAERLLDKVDRRGLGVRLLGIRLENLGMEASTGLQLSLDQAERPRAGAQAAADMVKQRFGTRAVGPGTLLPGAQGARAAGR
jgi:DNA polymerase-4